MMESIQGQLLVATPELVDPNFVRSVVLMVQHNEEGALGLILNRPTDTTIDEVWKQVSQSPCPSRRRLHLGGPCNGPLMAIHTESHLSEIEVLPGVHFSGTPERLSELTSIVDGQIEFFVGCAGWGPNQLESELERGSWNTIEALPEHVFGHPDDLWVGVTKTINRAKLVRMLHVRHVPDDASLN